MKFKVKIRKSVQEPPEAPSPPNPTQTPQKQEKAPQAATEAATAPSYSRPAAGYPPACSKGGEGAAAGTEAICYLCEEPIADERNAWIQHQPCHLDCAYEEDVVICARCRHDVVFEETVDTADGYMHRVCAERSDTPHWDVDENLNPVGTGSEPLMEPVEEGRPVFGDERWLSLSRQKRRKGKKDDPPLPAKAELKRIREEALALIDLARDELMIYPPQSDWRAYRNPKPVSRYDRESEWRSYGRGLTDQMPWYNALGGAARLKSCAKSSVSFKHGDDARNVARAWNTTTKPPTYRHYGGNEVSFPPALKQFAEWWTAGLYPDLDVLVERKEDSDKGGDIPGED